MLTTSQPSFVQVILTSTLGNSIDAGGGIQAGTGNVNIIGSDGRINGPLSTTIIDNLSGTNISGLGGDLSGTLGAADVLGARNDGDLLLDVDDDNNGTNTLRVRNGANATIFEVNEESATSGHQAQLPR